MKGVFTKKNNTSAENIFSVGEAILMKRVISTLASKIGNSAWLEVKQILFPEKEN